MQLNAEGKVYVVSRTPVTYDAAVVVAVFNDKVNAHKWCEQDSIITDTPSNYYEVEAFVVG